MKPLFKVGDKVIITKSNIDWVEPMDKYHGLIVEIQEYYQWDPTRNCIRFKNSAGFVWCYEEKHFKRVIEILDLIY